MASLLCSCLRRGTSISTAAALVSQRAELAHVRATVLADSLLTIEAKQQSVASLSPRSQWNGSTRTRDDGETGAGRGSSSWAPLQRAVRPPRSA